jgi:hypothetical protein
VAAGYGCSIYSCSGENNQYVIRFGWALPQTATGTTTNGSKVVHFTAMPPLMIPGRGLTGSNIPGGTKIVSADSVNNNITLSANATGNGSVTLTFSQECPVIGGWINGIETERVNNSIDLYNCQGVVVTANGLTAGAGLPFPQGDILSVSWSGGIVTANTRQPHNLFNPTIGTQIGSSGVWLMQLDTNQANNNGNASWMPDQSGVIRRSWARTARSQIRAY